MKSSVFWSDCGQVVAGIQESQLMKLKLNWTRWLLIWSIHYLPMEVFPHPLWPYQFDSFQNNFLSPFCLYSWVWLGRLGFSNWALWIVMFNMLQIAVLAQRANHMELVVSIRRCHSGWEPTQLHWHLCWRPFSSRCLAWELLHYELSWSDSVAMPVKVCQSVKRTLLLSGPHLFTSVVCYSMSFLLIVCASPSPSPPSLFSMFFPLLCCAVVSF